MISNYYPVKFFSVDNDIIIKQSETQFLTLKNCLIDSYSLELVSNGFVNFSVSVKAKEVYGDYSKDKLREDLIKQIYNEFK